MGGADRESPPLRQEKILKMKSRLKDRMETVTGKMEEMSQRMKDDEKAGK
jgi:hypothetical protein